MGHATENDVLILAMSLINLEWIKTIHKEQYRDLIFTYYMHYKLISSISNDNYQIPQSGYKPGWTATTLLNQTPYWIIRQEQDLFYMGQWSWILLRGKQNNSLLMITSYKAGKQPQRSSGNTAWNQREQILCKILLQNIKHANP